MQPKILRQKQVSEMVGLSRTTLWERERAGKFPKRIDLGGGRIGWLESEVIEWIESRARGIGQGGAA